LRTHADRPFSQGALLRIQRLRLLEVESLLDAEAQLALADVDALQAALDLWIEGAKIKRAARLAGTIVRRALFELL
jgi:hypothetical protein